MVVPTYMPVGVPGHTKVCVLGCVDVDVYV